LEEQWGWGWAWQWGQVWEARLEKLLEQMSELRLEQMSVPWGEVWDAMLWEKLLEHLWVHRSEEWWGWE